MWTKNTEIKLPIMVIICKQQDKNRENIQGTFWNKQLFWHSNLRITQIKIQYGVPTLIHTDFSKKYAIFKILGYCKLCEAYLAWKT